MTPSIDNSVDVLALIREIRAFEFDSEIQEFISQTGLYRIHDYETMGNRPIGTRDCGSVKLADTPKSLYRCMFLFRPERVSFQAMHKRGLLTLVSPDYKLVASIEFFKYELGLYFSATPEHTTGRGSTVINGGPGADNGVQPHGDVAVAWFGLLRELLDREWEIYGGNNFVV
jgi:hypothetical protein